MELAQTILGIIILLAWVLFKFVPMFIAEGKGFKVVRWYFAIDIVSLFVVLRLPNSRDTEITAEEAKLRKEKGDKIGLVLALINVAILIAIEFISTTKT